MGYKQSEPIEKIVQKNLMVRNMTVSAAESCTGGFLSHLLTKHPNASSIFKGSMVCYNADNKINLLGVDSKIIEKYSVVSEEVAKSMAKNANEKFKSTFAIATTGNAGPTKDKTKASIGVVCIAIATKDKVFAKTFHFGNQREKVIEKACNKALEWLLNIIKNQNINYN